MYGLYYSNSEKMYTIMAIPKATFPPKDDTELLYTSESYSRTQAFRDNILAGDAYTGCDTEEHY